MSSPVGGNRYTLVLDAGTSRARCFVFDSEGCVAAVRSRAWEYVESGEAYSLAREWQPRELWRMVCDLIRECIAASDASAAKIGSVAVTSQRQALVFLDEKGEELYAGPNLDLRAFFEGSEIDELHREKVYLTTGHLPSFLFAPAKLKWFERHRPEVHDRVSKVMTFADWLIYRLTGEIANERTLAGEAGILDIRRRDRCDSLLAEVCVEFERADMVDAGCVVGGVSAEAAEATMLKKGIPVVAAGADTQCGLLGMGVSGKGEVGVVAGWSAPVQMVTDVPTFSEDASTWAGCYPKCNKWVVESSAGDVGNAYSWLVRLLGGDGDAGFAEMDAAADNVPAGSEGMKAILGSARTHFSNPGMRVGGFIFPVPMTLSGIDKGNFARAALESVAFSIKANADHLGAVAGQPARSVALGGGMSRTRTLAPMLADVLGTGVRLSQSPDSSAVGAWLLAGTSAGEFTTIDEAAAWAKERTIWREPNPHQSAEYQYYYSEWQALAERLESFEL